MSQIDGLLRMLVAQEGDALDLVHGRIPAMSRGETPLRVFLPELRGPMWEALVDGLLDDGRAATLAAEGVVSFVYVLPDPPRTFRVRVVAGDAQGEASEAGVPTRIEVRRVHAGVPRVASAAPEPSGAAGPWSATEPADAGRHTEADDDPITAVVRAARDAARAHKRDADRARPPADGAAPVADAGGAGASGASSPPEAQDDTAPGDGSAGDPDGATAPARPRFVDPFARPDTPFARGELPTVGPPPGAKRTGAAPPSPPTVVPSVPKAGAPVAAPAPAPGPAPAPSRPVPAATAAAAPMGEPTTPTPRDPEATRRALAGLTALVRRARAREASDVHLTSREPARCRVDGQLRPLTADGGRLDGTDLDLAAALDGVLTADERRALHTGHSVDAAWSDAPGGRIRLHAYRCEPGLAVALRLLRGVAPRLDTLGLPVDLSPLAAIPHGLVLCTGATGSGKSTTLAALAREVLSTRGGLLVTLEDPIEFSFDGLGPGAMVRQRQVGRDVPDLAAGLRDALRADPDVLLVGEMRDPESISLALTAAETGHLVLGSLHARTAPGAIERILDAYGPERQAQVRSQLAQSLQAVVSMRLLPAASGEGRVLALGVLRWTRRVATHIRDGDTAALVTAMQSGKDDGMVPLERTLRDLVRAGRVTREAALAAAGDPGSLRAYL